MPKLSFELKIIFHLAQIEEILLQTHQELVFPQRTNDDVLVQNYRCLDADIKTTSAPPHLFFILVLSHGYFMQSYKWRQ